MAFKYTKEHLDFIREHYPSMQVPELTKAFNDRFGLDKTPQMIRACTKNHKIRCNRSGRFQKGDGAWNKGKEFRPGGRSVATQFKKGSVPANTKPLGHERICSKDGFILIKIEEENPYTGAKTRYKHKHLFVWEREKGPVPEGMVVSFIDGNKLNCDIDNLMLLTRAQLLYLNRNRYTELPNELKPSMLALAKVEVKRFEMEKK